MKIWIISDTHWRHVNIVKYTGRHVDYEKILRENWIKLVSHNDLVIHLGDVIFGQDKELHLKGIMEGLPGKKVLCRGNHDLKPAEFYMERGFDIVTDYFIYENLAFSHAPLTPLPYQTVKEKNQNGGFILKPVGVNIHGHFHNSDHRKKPDDPYYDYKYYIQNQSKYELIQIEDELRPFLLEDVLLKRVLR